MQNDLKSSDFGGKKWSFEDQEPQDRVLVMALGTLQELLNHEMIIFTLG